MPLQDGIQSHFAVADQTQFNSLISQLETLLQARLRNLSEAENNKYGTINEQNKLLVNKVLDFRNAQPALSSPDVNWTEFSADYFDRSFLETGAARLAALTKAMLETKRAHDYDNYQNALMDYKYTQYKNETQPGAGFDSKAAAIKQFFPSTKRSESPAPTPAPTP